MKDEDDEDLVLMFNRAMDEQFWHSAAAGGLTLWTIFLIVYSICFYNGSIVWAITRLSVGI